VRVVGDLGVPAAFGLRSGHVSRQNITLPIGVKAALQVEGGRVSLSILEAATAVSSTRAGAPAPH
jgi:muramoyltetrapeptide carboxypeptidase